MYKSIYLARRNPAFTAEQFHERWKQHSALTGTTQRIRPHFTQVVQCARFDDVVAPGATAEYDGANLLGLVRRESGYAVFDEPEHRDVMLPDELATFAGPIRDCTLVTKEQVCKEGGFSRFLLLRFLKFDASGDREEQIARWSSLQSIRDRDGPHAPLVCRSVTNLVVEPPPTAMDFDLVTETWFADAASLGRHANDRDVRAQIDEAINALCDPARTITFAARVNHSRPPLEDNPA